MTVMAVETSLVTSTWLGDGLLVQLTGDLGMEQMMDLRRILLSPLPEECKDVVVDAGEVTDMDFPALAVVFAAWAWAEDHGARFLVSRTSAAFDQALADHGVADDLPRLAPLPKAPAAAAAPVIPVQRVAAV